MRGGGVGKGVNADCTKEERKGGKWKDEGRKGERDEEEEKKQGRGSTIGDVKER